jgi:hypothetical protein
LSFANGGGTVVPTQLSSLSFRLSAVAPEPSTGVLALIGGLVLAGGAWRSRRGAAAA